MRLAHLAVAGSMIGVMLTATTFAQSSTPNDLRQPASVQRTAFEYDNYLYFAPGEGGNAAASDQKAATPAPAKTEAAPAAASSRSLAPSVRNAPAKPPCANGWGVALALLRTQAIRGRFRSPASLPTAASTSAVGSKPAPTRINTTPISTDPIGMRPNKFLNLNQLNGYAERVAKQEACEWDWGGRVDYMFGTDAPFTQAFGDHMLGLRLEQFVLRRTAALRLGHSAGLCRCDLRQFQNPRRPFLYADRL